MGRLWYPFVAGAAALMIAGIMLGQVIFWRVDYDRRFLFGALLGGLATVVLYAVMRAIAAR